MTTVFFSIYYDVRIRMTIMTTTGTLFCSFYSDNIIHTAIAYCVCTFYVIDIRWNVIITIINNNTVCNDIYSYFPKRLFCLWDNLLMFCDTFHSNKRIFLFDISRLGGCAYIVLNDLQQFHTFCLFVPGDFCTLFNLN